MRKKLAAEVAQLVEQLTCNQQVVGSNPTFSSTASGYEQVVGSPEGIPLGKSDLQLCCIRKSACGRFTPLGKTGFELYRHQDVEESAD